MRELPRQRDPDQEGADRGRHLQLLRDTGDQQGQSDQQGQPNNAPPEDGGARVRDVPLPPQPKRDDLGQPDGVRPVPAPVQVQPAPAR